MKNFFKKRIVHSSRGITMILVVLAMAVLGAVGVGMVSVVDDRKQNVVGNLESDKAFYVADGGLQYMIMNQLNGDSDFTDNVSPTGAPFTGSGISLGDGAFWVEYISQTSTLATLRVTGRVGTAVRVVEQSVTRTGGGLRFVTMIAGNMNMNSATGDLYGDSGIKGSMNLAPTVTVHGTITQDPTLNSPTLDFTTYRAMCTSTYSGNLTITSNYTGNLCVSGNVTIRQNVTYNGLLYATGNVRINGDNVTINGSIVAEGNFNGDNNRNLTLNPTHSATTHMPALAVQGTFDMKNVDWLNVTGVFWGSGNIDLTNSDNMVYRGSFITGGNLIFNSALNMNITFDADVMVGVPGLSFNSSNIQQNGMALANWKTY